jgi:seryl-tRNA synthetase
MLDIKLIRENSELVRNNLMKRGNPENIRMLNELVETDRKWRQNLTKLNELRHQRKQVTAEIATLKKAGKEAKSQVDKAKTIDTEITSVEKEVANEEEKERDFLLKLPNMLHDSVPV